MAETTKMWASRPDSNKPRPRDQARAKFADRNANKSHKAIIGIAILLVLSAVLYEVNGHHHTNTSANTSQVSHIAWSAH